MCNLHLTACKFVFFHRWVWTGLGLNLEGTKEHHKDHTGLFFGKPSQDWQMHWPSFFLVAFGLPWYDALRYVCQLSGGWRSHADCWGPRVGVSLKPQTCHGRVRPGRRINSQLTIYFNTGGNRWKWREKNRKECLWANMTPLFHCKDCLPNRNFKKVAIVRSFWIVSPGF